MNKNFGDNFGLINDEILYPYDFNTANNWLDNFLKTRFYEFGPYEDAVLKEKSILKVVISK